MRDFFSLIILCCETLSAGSKQKGAAFFFISHVPGNDDSATWFLLNLAPPPPKRRATINTLPFYNCDFFFFFFETKKCEKNNKRFECVCVCETECVFLFVYYFLFWCWVKNNNNWETKKPTRAPGWRSSWCREIPRVVLVLQTWSLRRRRWKCTSATGAATALLFISSNVSFSVWKFVYFVPFPLCIVIVYTKEFLPFPMGPDDVTQRNREFFGV